MGAGFTALFAIGFSGIAMVMWFARLKNVAIPTDRTLFLSLWTLGGVTGLLALAQQPGLISSLLALLAVLGGFGMLVLNYLAPQRAQAAIAVGDRIPAFHAMADDGNRFDSSSLAGSRVLIKFFRGHW